MRAPSGAPGGLPFSSRARLGVVAWLGGIVALAGAFLLACAPPAPPSAGARAAPGAAAAPSAARAAPPAAAAASPAEAWRYEVAARLRPDARRLDGEVRVQVPATPGGREALSFALRDDMAVSDAEVLEPAESAGRATLRKVGDDPNLQMTKRWELRPPRPIAAGAPAVVRVRFAGGGTVGLNFYLGPEGSFAGGVTTAWYPQFEGKRAVGSLKLSVPAGLVAVASGTLARRTEAGDETTFEFDARWPSHLSFTVGRYRVYRQAGAVPVTLYLLNERPFAQQMVEVCQRAIETLAGEFGPYPYGEFAVLEVAEGPARRSGFSGAAYEGFMQVRSDALADEVDVAFFGHEIGHQWWGLLVQADEGPEGRFMLDEALAQYGALRVVGRLGGPAAAERFRRGEVGLGGMAATRHAARLMAAGHDHPLGRLPDDSGAYELSDSKGYQVYDLLSRTLGREAFARALGAVTGRHAFGTLSWRQLWSDIETSTGRDLRTFYAEWFERPGAPVLSSSFRQAGGKVSVAVTQGRPAYHLRVPLQIEFEDGSALAAEAKLDGGDALVVLPAPRPVRAVRLDPYAEVFHLTAAAQAEAASLADFTRARLLWWPGKGSGAAEAMQILRGAIERLPESDVHGAEFYLRLRAGMIHQDEGRPREALAEFDRALAAPVRTPDALEGLYANVAKAARAAGDAQRADRATREARAAKQAYARRLTERR